MFENLARYFAERKLKAALEAGNLDSMIAALSILQKRPFDDSCLHYHFADGVSLSDYAINRSNELLKQYKEPRLSFFERLLPQLYQKTRRSVSYLIPSQSLISTLLRAAQPSEHEPPALSFWEGLLKRFSVLQKPEAEEEDSPFFESFISKLRDPTSFFVNESPNSPSNDDVNLDGSSIREAYNITQLLQKPELLKQRMGIIQEKTAIFPKTLPKKDINLIPEHLKHWRKTLHLVHEMNLDQIQEQQQNYLQMQEQDEALSMDQMFVSEERNVQARYTDLSELHILELGRHSSEAGIGEGILRCLKAKYPGAIELKISNDAKKELKKYDGGDFKRAIVNIKNFLTLDNLPLGLFIEEDPPGSRCFALRFSPVLREDLKGKNDAHLFMDPVGDDEFRQGFFEKGQNLPSIEGLIRENALGLNEEQTTFLIDTILKRAYYEEEIRIDIRIRKMLRERGEDAARLFPEFVQQLINMEQRKLDFKEGIKRNSEIENLYQLFLVYYLSVDYPGLLCDSVNIGLKKLANLSDPKLALFYVLCGTHSSSDRMASFQEAWKVFDSFLIFLERNNIEVTEDLVLILSKKYAYQYSCANHLFLSVPLIMDCVHLSYLPKFQSSLIGQLPTGLGIATEFLRRGASFVHEGMNLEEEDFPEINRELIAKDYQDLGLTASGCRALYLRYLATEVAPEKVEEAYKKCEEMCGGRSVTKEAWPQLQEYLLSLPTRFQAPPQRIEAAFANEYREEQNSLIEKTYSEEDIKDLFLKLRLDKALEEQLKEQIREINRGISSYAGCSPEYLRAEAIRIKKAAQEGQDVIPSIVCLLRQLHYNKTYNLSQKDPKEGEWLRLEQLVTILMSDHGSRLFQNETSEGKSLIISFTALLEAMQGKKVDIATHKDSMAILQSNNTVTMAKMLGLTVADKRSSPQDVRTASIYCVDVPNGVIDYLLTMKHIMKKLVLTRNADVILVDEVDHLLDLHTTTTIQISEPPNEASQEDQEALESFLLDLNDFVREELANRTDLISEEAQLALLREQFPEADEHFDLEYWLAAAVSAMAMEKNKDYVVEDNQVRIVHKKTSGDVDKRSIWGSGLHQCVALWEKKNNPDIKVPPVSKLIAEGDVSSFIKKYKKVCGYTGTLGTKAVVKTLHEMMGIEEAEPLVMPRAKRPAPKGVSWPRVVTEEGIVEERINRSFRQSAQFFEDREGQWLKLLETLSIARDRGLSSFVPFETIEDCDLFLEFLEANGFDDRIQVFDNKKEEEDPNAPYKYRPTESKVIHDANIPGMITLTTAAGGRAIDFKGINLCLITTPALSRVFEQEKDRVGRSGELGQVFEFYCIEDLDEEAREEWKKALAAGEQNQAIPDGAKIRTMRSALLEPMQERMQESDLSVIEARKSIRAFKHMMQSIMSDLWLEYDEHPQSEALKQDWRTFFNWVSQEQDVNKLAEKWKTMMQSVMAGILSECDDAQKAEINEVWGAFFDSVNQEPDVHKIVAQWEAFKKVHNEPGEEQHVGSSP